MSEEKKKAPSLRFKGFTDDWEQRKLGEISKIVSGGTPSTKVPDYWNGSINWYTPAELGNYIYTSQSQRRITQEGYDNSSAKLLPKGTVLFTSRAGIGKTAILLKPATTNQGFQSIVPKHDVLNSYFLFSLTNKLKHYGEIHGAGSTFVEISGKQLAKAKLFIPSFQEQTVIAKLLKLTDEILALQQRKLELLKIVRKALLDKSFADHANPSPQLRFKKFNGNWNHCKLGDIAHLVTGNDGNVDKLPILTISAANGWMLQKERFSKVIAGTELKRYTLLRKGELSYNHGNSKLATYGVVFMLDDYDKALVPKVYHSFKVTGANYPKFIETCFSTHKPDRELRKLITSGARMDGLLNITKEEFFSIKLFVPTFTEQLKIADLFTGSDKVINLQRQEVSQLNMTRKFLLQNMFI